MALLLDCFFSVKGKAAGMELVVSSLTLLAASLAVVAGILPLYRDFAERRRKKPK
jgi:hypothetical protein